MIIQFLSMSVNPNLVTLMRVIEENQDKMTNGEYLDAMNALCALHRDATTSAVAAASHQLPPSSIWDDLPALPALPPSSPPYSSIWDDLPDLPPLPPAYP